MEVDDDDDDDDDYDDEGLPVPDCFHEGRIWIFSKGRQMAVLHCAY